MLIRRLMLPGAALCLLASLALAQVRSSAITGTITDATGAVVPNAAVVITNQDTNVTLQATSNGAGEYVVPYLAAGRYSVEVKATGFQTYRRTDVTMGTATTVRVDVNLVTGSVGTAIEVRADAVTLQTETAVVQGAVSQNLIANIPNINNNPLYYATLQAGVVPSMQMYDGGKLGVGFQDRQAMSGIRINGGQLGTNDVQLDGVPVQGAAWHETTVIPVRDALQEVRVATNSFTAETGNAGGVISMVTKSGTNDFHGSLNYRARNEALNANGFANNFYGTRRGKYRVNEGGGTIGGPVIIPKLFNGKDKVFFFASYSRITNTVPINSRQRVPTDLERQGDFSQTLVADNSGNPVPVQVYNPFTAVPYQGSTTTFERQPYPNSIVTNADPYGLKLLQGYPAPNNPPVDVYNNQNYVFNGTSPTVRNNLNTRLDFHLSEKNSLYLSGGLSNGSVTKPNLWGEGATFTNVNWPGDIADDTPYAAVGDTITLNPTTVVDVRWGVNRVNTKSSWPVGSSFDYSAYGMPTAVQSLIALPGASPSVGNFGGPIAALNSDGWARKSEHQTNHSLNGSITKLAGKWTLKGGGEYRVYLGNWQDLVNGTPILNPWNNNNTNGWLGDLNGVNSGLITDPAQRGTPMAAAAIGNMGWGLTAGATLKPALAAKYFALYSQNDWKATDKLTITLGLRWEVQPGPTERYNRASSIDLTRKNDFAVSSQLTNPLASMGYIAFPGQDGYSRNLWDTEWGNFSPRIGAAYRVGNWVVRSGYGRTYLPSNTGFNANGLIYGTSAFAPGAQATPYGLAPNGVPVGRFEDPQNTLIIAAPGAVQSPTVYGNNAASFSVDLFDRNFKNGSQDQWNVFIERTVGSSWLLSVGYVGQHGRNLPWRLFPLNGRWAVPVATLMSWRDTWIASNGTQDLSSVTSPNPMTALIGKASGASGGASVSAQNLLQPYAGLLGAAVLANKGLTNYNALQLRATHAYSNGLEMSVNYSWSKATGLTGGGYGSAYAESQLYGTQAGGVDYFNLDNNRGIQSYDIPHRFIAVVAYDLPVGKGKLLDPGSGILRGIVGNWQLGTVVTLQSGNPWGPNCGSLNGRCNINPNAPLELPESLQRFYDGKTRVTLPNGRTITPGNGQYLKYNPDVVWQPIVQLPNGKYAVDPYYFGNAPMYPFRMPPFYNTNLTLNRKFQIKERARLEFLAEATNLLNAHNWYPNNVSSGPGAVLVEDPTTNTKVGQASSANYGALGTNFFQARQITLSLRLQF
jgi:hypothetical protein